MSDIRGHVNERIAAPCASCGEYQTAGVHVIETAERIGFFCGACCPACKGKCVGQSDNERLLIKRDG